MFVPSIRRHVLCAAVLAAAVAPASAQFGLFSWSFDSGGSGSGSVSASQMHIVGPETGFGSACPGGSTAAFTTVAPYDLLLVADYSVDNNDKGGFGADYLVTIVDGKESFVAGVCGDCQLVLEVPAGSSFGFGVHSFDCVAGEAIATLSNLVVQPAPGKVMAAGAQAGGDFGAALATLDDITGDGAAELAVGAPMALAGKGRVTLHLGSTLAVARVLTGTAAGDQFGTALAPAADLTGDGVRELLVGAPFADASAHDSGAALIFSSTTGLLLSTLPGAAANDHFGSAVGNAGDVDGDGLDDLLVGAPQHDGVGADSGQAVLLSGAGGAGLQSWSGAAAGDALGHALAGVGDVDGDGTPDVVVGSPGSNLSGNDVGTAQVFSGATGAELHVLLYAPCGGQSGDGFGSAVAGVGDVDGDGVPDIAVGAPFASCGTLWAGTARIFSGADAHLLSKVNGAAVASQAGFALSGAGDLDLNGELDVTVGLPTTNVLPTAVGHVQVVRGADAAQVFAAAGEQPADGFGRAVAAPGDSNGDGFPDLLVGSPAESPAEPGTVTLLQPGFLWTDLGHALAGTLGPPLLKGQGLLAPGTSIELTLSSTPPSQPATLVVGLHLLASSFKGGVLVPVPELLIGGLLSASPLTLSEHLPAGVPSGTELYFQMWIADAAGPKGLAASNAVRGSVP